ncbi:MAG TPA: xylulokinase [Kofleriaceae bacterium]|jgi:xylulokinase|nr:xylulokinase [Kofleriaceae bacterium]
MYLGIDLGTSEVKVALVDDAGRVIGVGRGGLAVARPHPAWSEQDPASWIAATLAAIAELGAVHPTELAAVTGIGLSGQMHGAVLLDAADRVLRPAILWNDTRAAAECAVLEARVPTSRQLTGNLAMPGFTAPKLLWVAAHEPDVFGRLAKVLLPKDYLRLWLTGEHVSDMSDAAGTLWLDVAARAWCDPMLAACGLDRSHMPRLVEGSSPGGALRGELARAWGMTGAVCVAGGAGDNAASAIGLGVIADGQGLLSLGTSGVFFVANDAYRPAPARGVHTFCHALPATWHQMAVMLSAASCLRWATQLTGAADEAQLIGEAEALGDGRRARAPVFLPYLSGERTPHADPYARGVWFGLDHDTSRAELGYSVLEGVAFGLADGLAAVRDAGGVAREVSLTGGGSRSRFWARLIASAFDLPLALRAGGEVGAALGAARLGQLAADPRATVAGVCTPPPLVEVAEPVAAWQPVLAGRLARFRALYPALHPLFLPEESPS